MLTNNFQSLADLAHLAGKCPRCSLCKFPPLVMVRSHAHSGICPAYEEFKFHSSSGGGMLVMAMSLLEGRSRVTDAVMRATYGCTACGGCDMACKFSSDIEVQEIVLQLRAKVFAERGPLPGHAAVLKRLREEGHPVVDADAGHDDWRRELDVRPSDNGAPILVWVGPYLRHQRRHWPQLQAALWNLGASGTEFAILEEEPYVGRAALEIGDKATFATHARAAAAAIAAHPGRQVVCLGAEDYATLRNHVPRVAAVAKPVRHVTEIYAEAIARGRLQPRRALHGTVAWHDASYIGRLCEPWVPWEGVEKKVFGQMIVTDPPRPVNRGAGGCYEPPRQVLHAIPGLQVREFNRRREYAFDSGECGQAAAVFPGFALNTARRRLEEARDLGIDTVVTECPQSLGLLREAAAAFPATRVAVRSLSELLAASCGQEGGGE